MLSRPSLVEALKAAAAGMLLLFVFTACHSTAPKPPKTDDEARVKYSKTYDPEIKEIMDLANKNRWEEAQIKATALHEEAPKNPVVERVYSWDVQTGQQRREQSLENEIRAIDAKNSVFDPTIKSILM